MTTSSVSLPAPELTDAQRAMLEEWQAQLGRLIERQRACFRRSHKQLETHLISSIRGAREALAEVCAPVRSELLTQASVAIGQYFGKVGDARTVAADFPAVVEFGRFLRGPELELTLRELAWAAEQTAAIIARILAGKEVWRFGAGGRDRV